MSRSLRRVAMLFAMAFILPHPVAAQSEESQTAERLASFEMTWPKQRMETVVARARAAVQSMTGQALRGRPTAVPINSVSKVPRWRVTVPGAPTLDIRYLPDYDEFRIIDTELATSTAPLSEIPEEEALKLAKGVFDELARHKLVNPRHYAWDSANVASTWVGGGSSDGKTVERKRDEYRITLRRMINGIEVANAGVRIAIHMSGRVSGLRFGGVSIASRDAGDVEEPVGKGRLLIRQLEPDNLQARIERELAPDKGEVEIAWSRVMYVMPENKRSAVVAPMHVVSYSLKFPSESGETIVSRRKTVGFSLVDPKASPVDLTPPLRAPRTEGNRKENR